MSDSSNLDYVTAKIHAIASRSIINKNFTEYKKIKTIEDLHKKMFPDDKIQTSTRYLYTRVEQLSKEEFFKNLNMLSSHFFYKNRIINTLISQYEIENIITVVNGYYTNLKTINKLFEFNTGSGLDYDVLYKKDLADLDTVKSFLKDSIFSFVLPFIEKRDPFYKIENELDKFYYKSLHHAIKSTGETDIKLMSLIREEMNWENIRWAFRSKIFFKKTFEDIEDTFIKESGLIDFNLIKTIFDIQFVAGETNRIFGPYPQIFRDIIAKAFNAEGDLSLSMLEELIDERLIKQYCLAFYVGEGMLPVVAFFYLKRKEYRNIIELVESLKYNMSMDNPQNSKIGS